MNKLNLYPCFDKWFEKGGTVYVYSDPHFNDSESINFRNQLNCTKALSNEEQIKRINSKCGKNDTLVILGDIGDIELVKKLKAGYKVLIMGNHDKGKTNYQRGKYVQCDFNCTTNELEEKYIDNHLFDEVYDGVLSIRSDTILSHEEIDFKYAFNIHGHDHYCRLMRKNSKSLDELEKEKYIEFQLNKIKERNAKNKKKVIKSFNCCCEWTGYYPVQLAKLLNSGVLKEIPDIHREAIDKQGKNRYPNKD